MCHQSKSPFRTDFVLDSLTENTTCLEKITVSMNKLCITWGRIDQSNQLPVEFACILEAGTIVTDKHTTDSKENNINFEEEHDRIIDAFKLKIFKNVHFNQSWVTNSTGQKSLCKAIDSQRISERFAPHFILNEFHIYQWISASLPVKLTKGYIKKVVVKYIVIIKK